VAGVGDDRQAHGARGCEVGQAGRERTRRISTNTGTAPLRANAFAVETKVNEGGITSSPGCTPIVSAASSSACVPDGVKKLCSPEYRWSQAAQR
jgi:hypothetical protein